MKTKVTMIVDVDPIELAPSGDLGDAEQDFMDGDVRLLEYPVMKIRIEAMTDEEAT